MRLLQFCELSPQGITGLREIYEEAFPTSERLSFDSLVGGTKDASRSLTALLQGDEVSAFASTLRLHGYPAVLLEYLAVHRRRRGTSLGGTLWSHVRRTAESTPTVRGVVLEVEDPDEPGIAVDTVALRRRRLVFYRRRGARVLPVLDYLIPDQQCAGELPMVLMWAPTGSGGSPDRTELRLLLRALHQEGYGLPEDNPLTCIARIPGETLE
ncbi:GNAT family N-acetyltransferase [Actinomadura craniellae]|uniref:GNAT family N-acetyltransferase n=1 Tax=Actinomadura craniellae TaxID=2231787 RepID=A0A365H6S3_9ACTN|nr:GNAT family N-acetyltransferase [Actinomadura craniellae]RAY14820.1 GNAT family N-acetyltransferase [Actinomadura craniellae]